MHVKQSENYIWRAVYGSKPLLLIEFIDGSYKLAEYTYIYEIIGVFILSFYLYELRLLQFFDMLRDGRLRIVELGDDVFIADKLTGRVTLHDKAENLDPDRMSQCVRNVCNE